MKIIVRNSTLVFENKDYTTQVLSNDIVTIGSYVSYLSGTLQSHSVSAYSKLFPYKGGDITATRLPSQWYGKSVICFYTDEGETFVKFASGGTQTENGLKDYIIATYSDDDHDYLIPEKDILALGDIKYFRIGAISVQNIGISTVKYKV